jgi:GNAT superfamily N-acetyltransferase
MKAPRDTQFKPAHMIVAGRFEERRPEDGIAVWDDRDPVRVGADGVICGYIFRKAGLCDVDLGGLEVRRDGDRFFLLDGGVEVSVALVTHFHERHSDVYVETLQPYRRRGYATKLLGWVSDWLTENGFIHEGGCAIDNLASVGLHRKLGFAVDGHIRWSRASGS